MAITTYSELQAAAAAWLVRGDLTARIPEFITLGEVRLNRVLRARRAETDAALTATPSSRTIALPATYTEPLGCWILGSGESDREALRQVDPALMPVSTQSGRPTMYGIDGAYLTFERPADQAYAVTLRHLAKFVLSDAAPTNALLSDAPDVYLFATLCEAAPFLRDAELAGAYEARLARAIGELNQKNARGKAGQTLSTEPAMLQHRRHGYDIRIDG